MNFPLIECVQAKSIMLISVREAVFKVVKKSLSETLNSVLLSNKYRLIV